MYIEPTLLATMTGVIGAMLAALWSYLMASKVAAPRAKRLIVEALTTDGPEVKAVRAALIQPALDAQYAAFTGQTAAGGTQIASEVENAVNEALGAFNEQLGPTISNHVLMAVNQAKAQETKGLQAQLEQLGMGDVIEEGKAMIMDQLPPGAVAYKRMMESRPSKKWTAEHPFEAQLYEGMKVLFSQYAQGQAVLGLGGAQQAQATEAAGKGFGVR